MESRPASSEEHPHDGGHDQHAERNRQHHFPSDSHELVKAVARPGGTIPNVQVHEDPDFEQEPVNVRETFGGATEDIVMTEFLSDDDAEQNNSNQRQHDTKCSQADRLYSKIAVPRHEDNANKCNRSQSQESQHRKQRENEVPGCSAQPGWKWAHPSTQPERDRDRGD